MSVEVTTSPDEPSKAEQAAEWMREKVNERGELYQEDAVHQLERLFGKEVVYDNANGNRAISKAVLDRFRMMAPDFVWERGEKRWRLRVSTDQEGRGQD